MNSEAEKSYIWREQNRLLAERISNKMDLANESFRFSVEAFEKQHRNQVIAARN